MRPLPADKARWRPLLVAIVASCAFSGTDLLATTIADDDPAPADLAALRQGLGPNELFLRVDVGSDQTLVLALDHEGQATVRVDVTRAELTRRAGRLYELVARPPGPQAHAPDVDAACAELAALLFGGLRAEIAGHSRIIVDLDPALPGLPLARLLAFDEPNGMAPAELVRAARPPTPGPSPAYSTDPARILVVAKSANRDDEEEDASAHEEIRMLSQLYRHVAVRSLAGPPQPAFRSLSEFDVVHFTTGSATDADAVLRAARAASLRLTGTRLVVLPGEAASDRDPDGQRLAGLFLEAGAPAVVASLWPIDDGSTANLMRELYDGLARGLSPGRALWEAQDRVRRSPGGAHPYHWSGFVLLGTGEASIPVSPASRRWGKIGLLVFLGTLVLWWWITHRRGRRLDAI